MYSVRLRFEEGRQILGINVGEECEKTEGGDLRWYKFRCIWKFTHSLEEGLRLSRGPEDECFCNVGGQQKRQRNLDSGFHKCLLCAWCQD